MTPQVIVNLPAGHQLDALCAEHVMGARWWRSDPSGRRALFVGSPPSWFTTHATGEEHLVIDWETYGGFPNYSGDVTAALAAAQHEIARSSYRVEITLLAAGAHVTLIATSGHGMQGDALGQTLAEALTRALVLAAWKRDAF